MRANPGKRHASVSYMTASAPPNRAANSESGTRPSSPTHPRVNSNDTVAPVARPPGFHQCAGPRHTRYTLVDRPQPTARWNPSVPLLPSLQRSLAFAAPTDDVCPLFGTKALFGSRPPYTGRPSGGISTLPTEPRTARAVSQFSVDFADRVSAILSSSKASQRPKGSQRGRWTASNRGDPSFAKGHDYPSGSGVRSQKAE